MLGSDTCDQGNREVPCALIDRRQSTAENLPRIVLHFRLSIEAFMAESMLQHDIHVKELVLLEETRRARSNTSPTGSSKGMID